VAKHPWDGCLHDRSTCETKVQKGCQKKCPRIKRCVEACPDGRDSGWKVAQACQLKCDSTDCLTVCVPE
jgi:hypothetical protein